MNQDVLHIIKENISTYSKGQKRIAGYILENYDKAAFMTAHRLGEASGTSESTVVRFAAELGYRGYPDMQKALQELIRGRLTSVQRIEASRSQMVGQDTLDSVLQRDIASLHETLESVDRDEFYRVVDKLIKARHIYILGVRSSAFLAGYLNFYLQWIFTNVTLVENSGGGEIFEQLLHIGPGDILLGISFPRYSKASVNAINFAKEHGADVIAITDSKMSPIYKIATAALLVSNDMISFVDSMTAPLSLLNALIVAIGQQKNEEVSSTFSEMEKIWSTYSVFGRVDDE